MWRVGTAAHALMLALAVLLSGYDGAPRSAPGHLTLLTIDTLRRGSLGAYGSELVQGSCCSVVRR